MKSKKLNLPNPPTYQNDPIFQQGYKSLMDWGQNLSRGDFGWLTPLLDNTQNSLKYAQSILEPQFRDTIQNIRNEAAANGQLESSTFTDALARSASDLNSNYQAIVSQQAINDNNTKLSLFGQGLDRIGQATTFGFQNQGAENEFNLRNYDNLVAQAIQNNKNANRANGWQQALSFAVPGFGTDYLRSQGVENVPGYGVADIAKIAAPFFGGFGGGNMGNGFGNTAVNYPGQYASNNPFGLIGNNYGQRYSFLNN